MSDNYEMHDTEVTLGSGRLLSLFFGLVVVCAVFFGLGYTLGHNSTVSGSAPIVSPATAAPAPTGSVKPTAVKTSSGPVPCAEGQPCGGQTPAQDLTVINAGATTPDATKAADRSARDAATVGMKVRQAPAPAPAPEVARTSSGNSQTATVQTGGVQPGFVVQIAAVSRKDDADALLGSLRKKNYPVFVLADAGDHLFHVQVGPFADRTAAQQIKDRLAGDGYNAIVK